MVQFANFLNINDLSDDELHVLLTSAYAFRDGKQVTLKRPVYAANLFFENSTRTHSSFQMAEQRLGVKLIDINPSTSSVTKGESLGDTLKTLQAIGVDFTVIRHHLNDWYTPMVEDENIHLGLVNAGDGSGQHPSQSLLDLMTIHDQFKTFTGLNIGIIGDITHSRVARSNAEILNRLGANVFFSGPKEWFSEEFNNFGTYLEVDELLPKLDVVMLLRVQTERLQKDDLNAFTALEYHQQYGLSKQRYNVLKDDAIIMHPAPVNRDVEISSDLVEAPKSKIFTQMHNGVFARMAILNAVLTSMDLVEE